MDKLLFLLSLLLIQHQITSFMFCFTKHSQSPSSTVGSSKNNLNEDTKQQVKSQLRSYHPHYINSISYPTPMTPHIYYGQVFGIKPVFLFKDIDLWDPSSIEQLTINGIEYTDASVKHYLLRRQQQFRYMLVLQIENSYNQEIDYRIDLFRRKDHYLVIFQYQNQFKSYVVYLTKKDTIIQLNREDLQGININIRNQSQTSARANWRFAEQIRWIGRNNIFNMFQTKFSGIIFQLEYVDKSLKDMVRLNLHELVNPKKLNLDEFSSKEEKINLVNLLPTKITKANKYQNCSVAAAQKLFDGLSYEYGILRIKNGNQPINNSPQPLLSFCPSRKRFPWGFLWDDGFHCQVAVRKDQILAINVIKSWLDTMLDNGWIPRQQNRGSERQYLCNCPMFMQKDIRDGNPPTLILALQYLKRNNRLGPGVLPVEYWNKIKKWYNWFVNTQKDGDIYLFRWHDSINQMGASFTSGMDDFPRPNYSQAHVDLQSWMYFFTRFMIQTSSIYSQSSTEYISNFNLLKNNFQFFIQPSTNLYKDISYGSHSPHFGYPSILPIAFGIPKYGTKEYNATITAIKQELDLGVGLASISRLNPLYLQNQNAYWKGPVWININYLFLRGLKLYYPQQSQLYTKIRNDLINTVCGNWQRSGYFYQNYINGKGSFSFPFNGWTSLIAIIVDENY